MQSVAGVSYHVTPMAKFEIAIPTIIEHEVRKSHLKDGDFTMIKGDKGGATKWGVTQKTLAEYRGHPVTIDDVKNLSLDEAELLYRHNFWDLICGDAITHQGVATKVFDMAVNLGPPMASHLLQRAINCVRPVEALPGTYIVGARTLAAMNRCDPTALMKALCAQQVSRYEELVHDEGPNDPDKQFEAGWLARAHWPFPATVALT